MAHSHFVRCVLLSSVTVAVSCGRPPAASGDDAKPRPDSALATRDKTLAELFQGRPGVMVQSVGAGVRLRIRAAGDWDGRGDPLFIIDDAPVEPPDGILSMNPNDIARIEIIKDDASASVYGLRGANGVVKITTKRKNLRPPLV